MRFSRQFAPLFDSRMTNVALIVHPERSGTKVENKHQIRTRVDESVYQTLQLEAKIQGLTISQLVEKRLSNSRKLPKVIFQNNEDFKRLQQQLEQLQESVNQIADTNQQVIVALLSDYLEDDSPDWETFSQEIANYIADNIQKPLEDVQKAINEQLHPLVDRVVHNKKILTKGKELF